MKLLYTALRELIFKCLEIRARAFNCLAAFLQQELICCEKHNLSSIVTPRTVTSVSDMRCVRSHSCKACCSKGVGENSIKWNLSGLACMPFFANHSIAFRPSCLKLPSDIIRPQGYRSTLAQVMACCLMAPSHYLNQCWLMISAVL